MKQLILLLGAPNDEQGYLSRIALDRIACAFSLWRWNEGVRLLCTGGFGPGFNTTDRPHAEYARQALMRMGVGKADFLAFVPSSNTVEDFRLAAPVILREQPDRLFIVTSDFHMERVQILERIILHYPVSVFIAASSTLNDEELAPLVAHEKEAVRRLRENNYHLY